MSLRKDSEIGKRELITKTFEVTGSEEDLRALADFLEQTYKRFNISIKKDRPLKVGKKYLEGDKIPRLTITPEAATSPILYPNLGRLLKGMAGNLRIGNNRAFTLTTGDLGVTKKMSFLPYSVRVLEDVLWGSAKRRGNIPVMVRGGRQVNFAGVVDDLDSIVKIDGYDGGNIFTKWNPECVLVENLDVHILDGAKGDPKVLDEKNKGYPPELPNRDYNVALLLGLRTKFNISPNTEVTINYKDWKEFVKRHKLKNYVDDELLQKPENVDELLKTVYSYIAARTFGIKKAKVVPFQRNAPNFVTDIIVGDKTKPDEVNGSFILYSGVVVGESDKLPMTMRKSGISKVGDISLSDLPI